jgi:hypothetical protein
MVAPSRRYLRSLPIAKTDLLKYRNDPIAYAWDILGSRLTHEQEGMLESVRTQRQTAVLASHSVGKTHLAAIAASHWFDTREQSIVYITAPSWDQCLGLTFKAVKRFRLRQNLPGKILDSGWVKDEDRYKETGHFIRAINAEKGEGFQGEHTAEMLMIFEEAVGVPPYIFEAAKGLMTNPENRQLLIANPTDHATPFGQAVDSGLYNVLHISALEHPNIVAELNGDPPPFPDAVRLLWVRDMLTSDAEAVTRPDGDCFKWHSLATIEGILMGRGSAQSASLPSPDTWWLPTANFQGRVLGQFPTQADENVIPRGWLERLVPLPRPAQVPEIGCDVARFGKDRTTIVRRQGPVCLKIRVLTQLDNLQVTAALKEEAADAARDAGLPPEAAKRIPIRIDVTGGLGTGPYDILRAEGYNAIPVNAGGRPQDKEQFVNVRSELWWQTRDRARDKDLDLSLLPKDTREKLIRELGAPKYKVDARGRKVVEEKEATKKTLGASPDIADGFNLAYGYVGRWWEDDDLKDFLRAQGSPAAAENGSGGGERARGWIETLSARSGR